MVVADECAEPVELREALIGDPRTFSERVTLATAQEREKDSGKYSERLGQSRY